VMGLESDSPVLVTLLELRRKKRKITCLSSVACSRSSTQDLIREGDLHSELSRVIGVQ
jgi:hypothetical protein